MNTNGHTLLRSPRTVPPWGTALVLGCLAAVLTACNVATSRQPLGESPASLRELGPEGIWRHEDGQVFFVRIADEAAGRLEVATVRRTDHGFELDRMPVLLRRQGDAILANVGKAESDREPDGEPEYTFGRLTLSGDSAILQLAASRAVRDFAMENGVGVAVGTNRPGGDEHPSVVVTNGWDRLARELAAPAGWRLLDMENPLVLVRQRKDFE